VPGSIFDVLSAAAYSGDSLEGGDGTLSPPRSLVGIKSNPRCLPIERRSVRYLNAKKAAFWSSTKYIDEDKGCAVIVALKPLSSCNIGEEFVNPVANCRRKHRRRKSIAECIFCGCLLVGDKIGGTYHCCLVDNSSSSFPTLSISSL